MHLHIPSLKEELRKIGVGLVLGGFVGGFFRSGFESQNTVAILTGIAFIFIGSLQGDHHE